MVSVVRANKTRPNNTDAYTAGDVINESTSAGTVWSFPDIGRDFGQPFVIKAATLHISTDEATDLQAILLLFTASPTAGNDNAACAVTDAQFQSSFVGHISFATDVDGTTGAVYTVNPDLLIKPAGDSKTLYGVLLANNAYTPAASSVLTITLVAANAQG